MMQLQRLKKQIEKAKKIKDPKESHLQVSLLQNEIKQIRQHYVGYLQSAKSTPHNCTSQNTVSKKTTQEKITKPKKMISNTHKRLNDNFKLSVKLSLAYVMN